MTAPRRDQLAGKALLVLFMVLTLIPFATLLSTALQPAGSIPTGFSWPSDPQWGNFAEAWRIAHLAPLIKSSLLIAVGVVPASLVLATLAGYGLATLKIPFSNLIFVVFLLGLTIPFESLITPLYYQMDSLGLLNTRWALVLPLIALYMPFGVFWMRAHFLTVPAELSEAAFIDGAGTWRTFRHIHLPLALPALSSLAILLFLWTWNQFVLAIVMVDDPLKRTMAGALGAFQGQYGTDIVLLSAGALLIMAPTIVVFVIFQRQFSRALLQGAVKG
ncbi:carbohydrate ABC transporter permease [Nocardioides mangrovi]|uniref:Carbohydrate ABC transporter permease n=1 Tax=Nocardioides mangrovi TaxID=2874580 RepID=A0ABS7UDU7_9ACTN|nr:carbohydrate ABC transporter permease [Nocardioides mangrovi]MBZ5738838.1 carbohydrate ABC transporter permease [Nocardioides mangrovi]